MNESGPAHTNAESLPPPAPERAPERLPLTPEEQAARGAEIERAHTEAIAEKAIRESQNTEAIARIKEGLLGIPRPEQQEQSAEISMTFGIGEKVPVSVRLDASGKVTEVLGDIQQGGFESYSTEEFQRLFDSYRKVGIPVGWKESALSDRLMIDGNMQTVKAFRIAKEDINAALRAGDIELRTDLERGLVARVVGRRG